MATTVIQNKIVAGAFAGLMSGRNVISFDPNTFTLVSNVARAIADQCIVRNAALTLPMADGDNANIGDVCYAAAYSVCIGVFPTSTTLADYTIPANQIVASAKQAASKLI